MYLKSDYKFELPEELIAKTALKDRAASRLLVVERKKNSFYEIPFTQFPDLLNYDDQLIFNNTKVIPARLIGQKTTGGKIEVFLLRALSDSRWSALLKPARKVKEGTELLFSDQLSGKVVKKQDDGIHEIEFIFGGDFYDVLENVGEVPLPHYMDRKSTFDDRERYQTLLAKEPGAVAAPTAGLHFSDEIFSQLHEKGVDVQTLTLHVGWGTFKPISVEDIREHQMHEEFYSIEEAAARAISEHEGRQIVIGTTTLRTLESMDSVKAGSGSTSLYIYPGYNFKFARHLFTNFHLPESSLFILTCTFGGKELIQEAYRYAIQERFRFYSYGDAMLIL